MILNRRVFISHSSENKEIAEQLSVYIERLGVRSEQIFCSSVISQGVKNGEKLGSAISDAIYKSRVLVFLLSYDFLHSAYCMQELGVGWYLSEQNKAKCFCLVLPDISLSDVKGFVNSKVFKFSFVDETHKSDLGLFAENICAELHIKQPRHSAQMNYESIFFSAVENMLSLLVERKQIRQEQEKAEKTEKEILKKTLQEKEKTIERLEDCLDTKRAEQSRLELETEMKTIEQVFLHFGFGDGVSKKQYNCFSKQFWFDVLNRYEELLIQLNKEPHDTFMEWAMATIYAAEGMEKKALEHVKNYVTLTEFGLYSKYFSNFFDGYKGSMAEIIKIVNSKAEREKEGIVKDSYIAFSKELHERELTLSNTEKESKAENIAE